MRSGYWPWAKWMSRWLRDATAHWSKPGTRPSFSTATTDWRVLIFPEVPKRRPTAPRGRGNHRDHARPSQIADRRVPRPFDQPRRCAASRTAAKPMDQASHAHGRFTWRGSHDANHRVQFLVRSRSGEHAGPVAVEPQRTMHTGLAVGQGTPARSIITDKAEGIRHHAFAAASVDPLRQARSTDRHFRGRGPASLRQRARTARS